MKSKIIFVLWLMSIIIFISALGQQTATDWNNKGIALVQQEKYDEALEAFNKSIELDPENSTLWKNKCHTLTLMSRYSDAIQACDKAIEINPCNFLAWHDKGTAFKSLGNATGAAAAFDRSEVCRNDYE
jgi:tetratricopeptide (TPR) repeat protein